jgi:hypothetical protein
MTSRCTLDIICGIISILSPFQAYSCIEIIYDLIRGCHGNSDKRSSELRFWIHQCYWQVREKLNF